MSEKEKTVVERLEQAIKNATEKQQEYMLGIAEGVALANRTKKDEE